MLSGEVVVLAGAPLLVVFAALRAGAGIERCRIAFETLFGAYVLVLLATVLFPMRVSAGLRADDTVWDYATFLRYWVNLTPLATIGQLLDHPSPTQAVRQIGGNVLLLVPLGAMLPALWVRMRRFGTALMTILATALGIEIVQYLARIARLSLRSIDVDDAILNVAGGTIGFAVWLAASRLACWRARVSR